MKLTLLKWLDGKWEDVRGYLQEDLDHIQSAINYHNGQVFNGTKLKSGTAEGDATSTPQYIANTGTKNGFKWSLVDLAKGVMNRLPFANVVQASSAARLLGRRSASAGDFEEMTVGAGLQIVGTELSATASGSGSPGPPGPPGEDGDETDHLMLYPPPVLMTQRLDELGPVTIGDTLVRGADGWALLHAPTSGLFLGGNGPGTAPSYQAPFGVASPWYTAGQFQLIAQSISGTVIGTLGLPAIGTVTGVQAPAGGSFSDAYYLQFLTTTTLNSTAVVVGGTGTNVGPINFLWDFDIVFIIRTDASAVTGVRYWFGITNSSPGSSDTLTSNGIAFRFSTVAGDGGWVGVTYDGTQSVTGTVATIAANTRYALRIRKVGGTVFFSVNGGAETSTTTHVPTNDLFRAPALVVANAAGGTGSARSFYFSRAFASYGT